MMPPSGKDKRRQNDAGDNVVGTLLRARRQEARLSQQAVGRRAGLSLEILRRIEAGKNASLESVGRVAAVFGPETRRGVVLMLTMPLLHRRALAECWRLERELRRSHERLQRLTAREEADAGRKEVAT